MILDRFGAEFQHASDRLVLCPCTSRSVAALDQAGLADKDIQTRSSIIHRFDWGDPRGQYQAGNIINVTVRDVDRSTLQLSQCRIAPSLLAMRYDDLANMFAIFEVAVSSSGLFERKNGINDGIDAVDGDEL